VEFRRKSEFEPGLIYIHKVLDWTSWFAPHKKEFVAGYTEPLAFAFKKTQSGQTKLWYRDFGASRSVWFGEDGSPEGQGISILNSHPEGQPQPVPLRHVLSQEVLKGVTTSAKVGVFRILARRLINNSLFSTGNQGYSTRSTKRCFPREVFGDWRLWYQR
jgi:hypothetical protein